MFRLKTDIAEFYKNDAKFITEKNEISNEIENKNFNFRKSSILNLKNAERVFSDKNDNFSEKVQEDIKLISNYMMSAEGTAFNIKQQGLQLNNPNLYKDNQNKKYNPSSILIATSIGYTGLKPIRQGYSLYNGRDFDSFITNLNYIGQNRLVDLTKEVVQNKNKKEGDVIDTISGITGPNSMFGIGRTDIKLYHPTIKQTKDQFVPYLDSMLNKIRNPKNEEHETNIDIPNINISKFGELYQNEEEIKTKIKNEVSFPKTTQNDIGNPHRYSVLAYDQLQNMGEFVDFRNKVKDKTISGKGYDNRDNVIVRFGMIDPGKNTDKSNIEKSNQFDRINILKENEKNDNIDDFIKFKIRDINNKNKFIIFRSTFNNINDDITPAWNSQEVPGRADMIYKYSSFERSVSIDFIVPTYSRNELISNYRRVNELAKYTVPEYDNNKSFSSPFIRLTIGDYFNNTPGFISSLNFQFDNETPWEINLEKDDNIGELPHHINISLTFTIISDVIPSKNMNFFSILDNIL